MNFGLLLQTVDDLPTEPLTITQRLLKHFFDNVLLEHVGLICVLPLAIHLDICAEQVEGVTLSHF